ncbi:MAG: sulfate transporter family protein [Pseudomonadota bacterium]
MLQSINLTLSQMFSAGFRNVLWKALGITIALLILLWFGLEAVANIILLPLLGPWPWATTVLSWLLGAGLIIGLGFLIAPVTAIFAGFFIDDVAEQVERRHYSADPPGRALPTSQTLGITLKFTGLVIVANLFALALLLVPGINLAIFYVVNGYLLGIEYFQFAAFRYMSVRDARALRKKKSGSVFLTGTLIAFCASIPIINIFTPLFAAALMVHQVKRMMRAA